MRHRRCDGSVGGRCGAAGRLTSACRFATTRWLTTASAIDRGAGGVTTWLAGSADQIIRAMVARAKYATIRYLGNTHFSGLLAATTSGPGSLHMRPADLLIIFHLGAALRFATAGRFATTGGFTTAGVSNATGRFATTSVARRLTTTVVTKTKAKALGAEAERQNDRPENDIPFHLFHLLNSDSLVPFASDLIV